MGGIINLHTFIVGWKEKGQNRKFQTYFIRIKKLLYFLISKNNLVKRNKRRE